MVDIVLIPFATLVNDGIVVQAIVNGWYQERRSSMTVDLIWGAVYLGQVVAVATLIMVIFGLFRGE